MERVYVQAEKRTKRAVSNVDRNCMGWGKVKLTLSKCAKMHWQIRSPSHPNSGKRLCVYTDASNRACDVIVTKVGIKVLSKPRLDQSHDAIAFISGRDLTLPNIVGR